MKKKFPGMATNKTLIIEYKNVLIEIIVHQLMIELARKCQVTNN
jgi:hypothetical protein